MKVTEWLIYLCVVIAMLLPHHIYGYPLKITPESITELDEKNYYTKNVDTKHKQQEMTQQMSVSQKSVDEDLNGPEQALPVVVIITTTPLHTSPSTAGPPPRYTYTIALSVLATVITTALTIILILICKPPCCKCFTNWLNTGLAGTAGETSPKSMKDSLFAEQVHSQRGVTTGTLPKASERSLSHLMAPVSAKITPEIRKEMERRRNFATISAQGSDFWKAQVKNLLMQRKSEYRHSRSTFTKFTAKTKADSETITTVSSISTPPDVNGFKPSVPKNWVPGRGDPKTLVRKQKKSGNFFGGDESTRSDMRIPRRKKKRINATTKNSVEPNVYTTPQPLVMKKKKVYTAPVLPS